MGSRLDSTQLRLCQQLLRLPWVTRWVYLQFSLDPGSDSDFACKWTHSCRKAGSGIWQEHGGSVEPNKDLFYQEACGLQSSHLEQWLTRTLSVPCWGLTEPRPVAGTQGHASASPCQQLPRDFGCKQGFTSWRGLTSAWIFLWNNWYNNCMCF